MDNSLFHIFSEDTAGRHPISGSFTDPFRYVPHPLVIHAAQDVTEHINRLCGNEAVALGFSEGKMLGVLVAIDSSGRTGYLAGFSGNVGGKSLIEGFVPPIYDLLDPSCPFRQREEEISSINRQIRELESSKVLSEMRKGIADMRRQMDEDINSAKASARLAKLERDAIRSETADESRLEELIRESQFGKAEIRRLKSMWAEKINAAEHSLSSRLDEIASLKSRRAAMSDALQKWIFSRYIVHNATGEEASVAEIFAQKGLAPPGGTGECAAPKLLEYAYRHFLRPVAMGEFWYGASPCTAVRTHGHFYPSCTSKCGPLLGFMLRGIAVGHRADDEEAWFGYPEIIYEDGSIIVASKPSGMPSVPGLDGRISLQEWLRTRSASEIYSVHRLDMDTSGIMVFAKTHETASCLMEQFSSHSVKKTYTARLSASDSIASRGMQSDNIGNCTVTRHTGTSAMLRTGDKGSISIPLSPDYDERPRQKADLKSGKESVTEYEVTKICPDGRAEVIFRPVTGRTHQLRIHSAHVLGLGRPIEGDMLYGSSSIFRKPTSARLCLHALEIEFRHPDSGKQMHFTSALNSYPEEQSAY